MEELIFKYFPNLSATQKEQFKMLFPLYKDWNTSKLTLSAAQILITYMNITFTYSYCKIL